MAGYPSINCPLHVFRLQQHAAITASGDSIVTYKVPFDCRIVKIKGGVEAIDDATDVDLDVEVGTTDLCDPIAVADSSAIVSGGVWATPDSGEEDLDADDVLHLDVDITGGSSPTVTGAYVEVWVVRKGE